MSRIIAASGKEAFIRRLAYTGHNNHWGGCFQFQLKGQRQRCEEAKNNNNNCFLRPWSLQQHGGFCSRGLPVKGKHRAHLTIALPFSAHRPWHPVRKVPTQWPLPVEAHAPTEPGSGVNRHFVFFCFAMWAWAKIMRLSNDGATAHRSLSSWK